MIGYVTIGADDVRKAKAFYETVLGVIGWKEFADYGQYVAFAPGGLQGGQAIWLCQPYDKQPARHGNGIMIGLQADSPAQVDALHAAALAGGGLDEGAPGPRDAYGPNWYGAYFRDPTGNKLSVFHDKPAQG